MAKKKLECAAVIYHGAGHQSRTRCNLTRKHTVHETVYGEFEQEAEWTGAEAFTGFFDKPPTKDKK